MQPASDGGGARRRTNLRRYGPLGVIVVLLLGIGAVVVAGRRRRRRSATVPTPPGPPATSTGRRPRAWSPGRPPRRAGCRSPTTRRTRTAPSTTTSGPTRCDTELGTVAVPSVYALPCVPAFDGDNGGATAQGVTADAIKVVYYAPEQNADLESILGGLGVNDTADQRARDPAGLRRDLRLVRPSSTVARSSSSGSRPAGRPTTSWPRRPTPPTSSPWSRSPSSAGRRSTAGRSPRRSPTPASPATAAAACCPTRWSSTWRRTCGAPRPAPTSSSACSTRGPPPARSSTASTSTSPTSPAATCRAQHRKVGVIHFEQDPPLYGETSDEADRTLRRGRLHRVVHPRPAQHAGQGHRAHRPLQVRGRQHDRVPGRPVHARVPHHGGHRPGLLPRVDLHGHGAHRHQRPRPLVGPGPDGARLRHLAAGGADLAGPAGGR